MGSALTIEVGVGDHEQVEVRHAEPELLERGDPPLIGANEFGPRSWLRTFATADQIALPLSCTCAYFTPFWLAGQALAFT